MGSDALRYPITDTYYQFIRSAGQTIKKRLNLVDTFIVAIAASRRGETVYTEIAQLKDHVSYLREKYVNAFDTSTDDLPERANFEKIMYAVLEDALEIATKEKLISGAIAGTYLSRMGGENKGDDE